MSRMITAAILAVVASLAQEAVAQQGSVAEQIRREASRPNATDEGRPLPLACSWQCGEYPGPSCAGWRPENQIALVEQGHYLLPWFGHPAAGPLPAHRNDSFFAYYERAIKKARQLRLPLTFIASQWESGLSQKPYLELPPDDNPNVVAVGETILPQVSPFGPVCVKFGDDLFVGARRLETGQRYLGGKTRLGIPALTIAAILFPQADLAGGELLRGGGMEGPFSGGLAAGWVRNCYGSNDVVFAEETRDVHSGRAAQRVTCTKFISGGVQFHSGAVAVEKGKPYTVRLWMKGDVQSPIYVGLRKRGEPYTGYLVRHERVKRQWRPYVLTGAASDTDPQCGLFLMFAGTGTLLVDDVSVLPGIHEEISASDVSPQKGNRIFNSGFEAGPEGWTPTDGFVIDRTTAHSGRFSARLGAVDLPGVTLPLNRPLPRRRALAARRRALNAGRFRCVPACATRSAPGSGPPGRTRE